MTPVSLTLTHRWVGAHVIICHDRCLTWPWHHSKCYLSQKIQDWKSSSKSAVCSGNVSSPGHCILRALYIHPAYWFSMVLHNQSVSWSLLGAVSSLSHCTFCIYVCSVVAPLWFCLELCNRKKLLSDKFSSSWSRDCSSSANQHKWLLPLPLLQVWCIVIEKNCYMTNFLLPESETAVPVQINTSDCCLCLCCRYGTL